jgi:PAS domain S-box-containing protein
MVKEDRNINIILGYIVFVTLLLSTGTVIFLGSKHTKNQINELTTNLIRTNELLYDFKKGMLSIQDQIDRHIDATTSAEKDSAQAEIARITLANNIRLQLIKTRLTDPNAMVLVNELDRQRILAISLRPELFRISKSNKDSALEFNRLYQNQAFHKFLIAYDNLSDYAIKTTQNKSEYLQKFISKTQIRIFVLVLLSIVSLLYLGWLVYTSKQQIIKQSKIIEKREAKFNSFIEAMPDASLAVNKSGEIVYLNNQASILFGYTRDELLNNKIEMLMPERLRANHPKQREGYYANPENRMMGGSSKDLYGRKKDGSEFACDIALNSIETDEGVIVLSTIRDITEKNKAELALINSERQLNNAQKIAHLGSWEHSLIDRKTYWSDETYRIFEIDKNELDQYLCYEAYLNLIHPDDLEMIKSVYKESVDNKTTYTKDYRLLFSDGRIKYVEEQCETIYDTNNIPIKSIGTIQDITVRKIAELKVRDSESQLKKAQEIANLGSWELDIVKNILIWSDEIYRIFEIDKNKFGASYEAFINAVHPDDKEIVNSAYVDSVKNRTSYRIIHRLLFLDGRIKYVEEQCETNYDANGVPLKSFGTVQDITERIKAEEMLRESQVKYQSLFENMLDGVYKSSPDGKFFDVNQAMVKMLGYKDKKELMAIDIKKDLFFNESDREEARKKEESGKVAVIKLRKKDGTEIWAEDRGQYILDTNGNLLYNEGILRDVTEKVKAEKELLRSEIFNRGVLNSLSQHIAVIDSKGTIVEVNEAWKDFARLNGDTTLKRAAEGINYIEVCEKSIKAGDNYAKEALDGIRSIFNQDKEVFTMEYPCHSPSEERWFMMRVTEFKSDKPMLVISHGDVTKRKMAEIERERVAKDLIYKNKDLEQFAYIVSHNLRAPVANIMGLTNILTEPDIPEDFKLESMKGLFQSANKLDEVIKDLNTILQVRGQVNEFKEHVVFSTIVSSIENSIDLLIKNSGAILTYDFSEIDNIRTVKSYIYSIFYNLIINSIKFKKEGIQPEIKIVSNLNGKKVIISFKDNGIGFDLNRQKENIFGLYKRFNPEIEGKGVGLYMIKQQIEALGGTIELKSELGNGSEFIIEIQNS